MKILLNGEFQEIVNNSTVADLVHTLELEGRRPAVEARLRALEKAAEKWLRAYPYNGHHVYSNFRVMTNDWTPGKHSAKMKLEVETRDRATNTYHRITVRVTVLLASMQVSDYRILD